MYKADKWQAAAETSSLKQDVLSYESPLKYFRAYRFHPQYFDDVPGGLKSLTYSSRIDPMQPLCPFNLAGESCPGDACDFQHMDKLALPGKSRLGLQDCCGQSAGSLPSGIANLR